MSILKHIFIAVVISQLYILNDNADAQNKTSEKPMINWNAIQKWPFNCGLLCIAVHPNGKPFCSIKKWWCCRWCRHQFYKCQMFYPYWYCYQQAICCLGKCICKGLKAPFVSSKRG